jgi:hypothetical protein
MRHPFAFVSILSIGLVACNATKPVETPVADEIVISIDRSVEPVQGDIIRSREFLVMEGAAKVRVLVRELEADGSSKLQLVDPTVVPDSLAFFTAYYAGGGDDVRVRRAGDGLVVERRMNDETGAQCGAWETLQMVQVSAETAVTVDREGEMVDQLMFECE